jgi:hypothetical protein
MAHQFAVILMGCGAHIERFELVRFEGLRVKARAASVCGKEPAAASLVEAMKLEANRVALQHAGLQISCCCKDHMQLALTERDAEP